MKDEFDKLIDNAKNLELGSAEKQLMKKALLLHIERTRPKAEVFWHRGGANAEKPLPVFNSFLLRPVFLKRAAVALLISLFVSSSVSFAAENALPGDVLYPVKVGINEKAIELIKFNAESKAKWNTRVAERRLEEAEKLAGKNMLSLKARAKIEANFEKHSERVRERISRFETEKNLKAAADLGSNFEITLKVHEKILDRISKEETETNSEIRPILDKVRKKIKESEEYQVRIKADAKPDEKQNNEPKNESGSSGRPQSNRNEHKNPKSNTANAGQKKRN